MSGTSKMIRSEYNIADLGCIDWFEDGYFFKIYRNRIGAIIFKIFAFRTSDKIRDMKRREAKKIGRIIVSVTIQPLRGDGSSMKNTIIVDPISGLSRPAEEPPFKDERIRYEFYRGIENRFPGTLTDRRLGGGKKI